MSDCSSDNLLKTGPLVGLAIAGVFLFEGIVGALVWLVIVLKRGRRTKKSKSDQLLAGERRTFEEGEMTACTRRSSFIEKWLGREAVTTYTPVEIDERSYEKPPYATYVPDRPTVHPSREQTQPIVPSNLSIRPSLDQHGGDVSFYSTAVAASLVVPSQVPALLYDSPPVPSLPLPRPHRPDLPKLDIPEPPPPPRRDHQQPSVTSQTSYLRRLSRNLIDTFSPSPSPPSFPRKPDPPTPPPFMSIESVDAGNGKIERKRSQIVRSLPTVPSGLAVEL